MKKIYFNGKFAAQSLTGVQRVAHGMLLALDELLHDETPLLDRQWILLCPKDAKLPSLRHIQVRTPGPSVGLHAWEQICLPWLARDGLLVNLSGSAPAFAFRQVCLLHDAAIFDRPDAYSPMFLTWYRWLFRRVARTSIGILTVSEFSRSRLVERLGIPQARIEVIYPGADHLVGLVGSTRFLQTVDLQGTQFVLAVGGDNPNKNLAAAIAAFSTLTDPNLRLVVAGGSNNAVFAASARGDDDEDARVVRLGRVTDDELKSLLEAAEALIFVSLYEGFGLPPLEAMSCGCPVLVSTAGSLPEVCLDAAVYVDPHSVPDIARALRNLLDSPALRRQLAARGRRLVAEFGWARAARAFRKYLLEIDIAREEPGS